MSVDQIAANQLYSPVKVAALADCSANQLAHAAVFTCPLMLQVVSVQGRPRGLQKKLHGERLAEQVADPEPQCLDRLVSRDVVGQ